MTLDERSFILDTSTLIFLVNPAKEERAADCAAWFARLRARGARFYLPALAFHEAMRGAELLAMREGDRAEIRALKELTQIGGVRLLRIENRVLDRAAKLWAQARSKHRATDDKRLSGDAVVAAEAQLLRRQENGKVVVTDNTKHIGLFIAAAPFEDVRS